MFLFCYFLATGVQYSRSFAARRPPSLPPSPDTSMNQFFSLPEGSKLPVAACEVFFNLYRTVKKQSL